MKFWDLVPTVERQPWGYLVLGLSILPGIGTILAAGLTRDMKQLAFGLIQLLLFWTFIPWAWSIIWGILVVIKKP